MMDRFFNLVRLARIRLIDDTGPIQLVQVDEGQIGPDNGRRLVDRVKRVIHFGLASVPPIGSEAVLLSQGGSRSHSLAIGTNHQPSRLRNLQPGDSALYDVRGAFVSLTAAGLTIDAAGLPVIIRNTSTVTVTASDKVRIEAPQVEVTGDVISRAGGTPVSLNALRDAYDQHKHGGVKAGGDTSGLSDHIV